MGADFVNCVLYTKAVARLPLRWLGFLVCYVMLHKRPGQRLVIVKDGERKGPLPTTRSDDDDDDDVTFRTIIAKFTGNGS